MSKHFSTRLEDAAAAGNAADVVKYYKKARDANQVLASVSVMHMLDNITTARLSENDLQQIGMVTDLQQWEDSVAKSLAGLKKEPQLQTELKRLHRGFTRMYNAWSNGTLRNDRLANTLNEVADEQLFQLWNANREGSHDNAALVSRVTEGYKKQLEVLKESWFSGSVDEKVKSALDTHVATMFVNEWNNKEVVNQETQEEITNNGKKALFDNLKAGTLDDNLKTFVLDSIGHHLYSLIENRKLEKLSLLGSKIEGIKERVFTVDLRAAYLEAVKITLDDWINDRIDAGAKRQLEEIVDAYFVTMIKGMSSDEVQAFRVLGVKSTFETMRSGELDDTLSGILKSFGQETIQQELRLMTTPGKTDNDTVLLQEKIAKSVIGQIRSEWQTSNLRRPEQADRSSSSVSASMDASVFSEKEAKFIHKNVLSSLKQQDKAIQRAVYPSAMQGFFQAAGNDEPVRVEENTFSLGRKFGGK